MMVHAMPELMHPSLAPSQGCEPTWCIAQTPVGMGHPTYFIADIAANHDGDLERAKALIWQAKAAGANAAKFQHFLAKDIVSDAGFKALGNQQSHQARWQKSVYEVYQQYECPRDWTQTLLETCREADIHFFTAPYDLNALHTLAPHMPAIKIGSGDITWTQMLAQAAHYHKPLLLATGASSQADVDRALKQVLSHHQQVCLMQCNTNYTGSLENFRYINLNVLRHWATRYPHLVLGLSDHTPGHTTVLGAVTLGARVIEKHFTDDTSRTGPDHGFSMTPQTWRAMVDATRELELALGDGIKRVEMNEAQTVVLQRRGVRAKHPLPQGHILQEEDVTLLRPAPHEGLFPYELESLLGKPLAHPLEADALIPASDYRSACAT